MRDPFKNFTKHHLELELIEATQELVRARNNAAAFQLRVNFSHDDADSKGSLAYWVRKLQFIELLVRDLRSAIWQRNVNGE